MFIAFETALFLYKNINRKSSDLELFLTLKCRCLRLLSRVKTADAKLNYCSAGVGLKPFMV